MTGQVPRRRILVVDDDPSILRTVGRILERDYEVHGVASGAEALQLSARLCPDVAIVDIRMPEINGLELMGRLRAAQPDLDVIVMTGTAEEPDANLVQAIVAGAFYFVQKPFDRRVLLTLVIRCLELRRLRDEQQQHVRTLEKDLEEARKFQLSLLPPPQAQLGGLSIAARYLACRELAGDFYDYAAVDSHNVAIVIADVVGHGTSAAMLTSIVKSAFHAALADEYDPVRVVQRVKDGIRAFDPGRFITLCAAQVDLTANSLIYANAGHPPLLLHRQHESPRLLDSTGPLVSSMFLDIPCQRRQVQVGPGDLMLFYTDGVTEAHGTPGLFGVDRLTRAVTQRRNSGSQLVDELLAAVTEFSAGRPAQDDLTLVVAEITDPASEVFT